MTVSVTTVFTHAVTPFPKEITQNEKQLVQVTLNAYVFLPYSSKTQSTTILLPSSNIESFTRVTPVNTNDNEITYGPYPDLPLYSHTRIQLHYENNGPFVGVVSLERVIEVSHWGNIAVEEHYHIKHCGKLLTDAYYIQTCMWVCLLSSLVPGHEHYITKSTRPGDKANCKHVDLQCRCLLYILYVPHDVRVYTVHFLFYSLYGYNAI